jgi:hypothetical protein
MPRQLIVAVALLASLVGEAAAQGVVVAPHAVYLDHRTRSGSITLYNPGVDPAEVTISSIYGYPVTDSVGHFMLQVPDSVEPGMPAATAWIEAFPRRMILRPLQRQTVRLLARPPQGLADGEYWSRIVISAKGGAIQVANADSSRIQIGLALEVRTIIPLIYRKGMLHTGLEISNLRAVASGDSLSVRAHLQRLGTAAFVGIAKGTLLGETGATVASFQQPLAVYYDVEPVFLMSTKGLASGAYRLRIELSTDRTDIAPDQLLRTPVVRDSLAVVLP